MAFVDCCLLLYTFSSPFCFCSSKISALPGLRPGLNNSPWKVGVFLSKSTFIPVLLPLGPCFYGAHMDVRHDLVAVSRHTHENSFKSKCQWDIGCCVGNYKMAKKELSAPPKKLMRNYKVCLSVSQGTFKNINKLNL